MLGLRTGGSMLCMLCSRSAVSCRGMTSYSCHVWPGGTCALSTAECTHSNAGLKPGKHAIACAPPVCSLKTIYIANLKSDPSQKRVAWQAILDTEQQDELCSSPTALERQHTLHMLLWTTKGTCSGRHCPALPTPACCLSKYPSELPA